MSDQYSFVPINSSSFPTSIRSIVLNNNSQHLRAVIFPLNKSADNNISFCSVSEFSKDSFTNIYLCNCSVEIHKYFELICIHLINNHFFYFHKVFCKKLIKIYSWLKTFSVKCYAILTGRKFLCCEFSYILCMPIKKFKCHRS